MYAWIQLPSAAHMMQRRREANLGAPILLELQELWIKLLASLPSARVGDHAVLAASQDMATEDCRVGGIRCMFALPSFRSDHLPRLQFRSEWSVVQVSDRQRQSGHHHGRFFWHWPGKPSPPPSALAASKVLRPSMCSSMCSMCSAMCSSMCFQCWAVLAVVSA